MLTDFQGFCIDELQEKIDKREEEIQLYVALFCSMVACLVMLGGHVFC